MSAASAYKPKRRGPDGPRLRCGPALAGKGPIDGVARTGEDDQVAEVGKRTLRVTVAPADGFQTAPGPRRIKLEVGTPTCP